MAAASLYPKSSQGMNAHQSILHTISKLFLLVIFFLLFGNLFLLAPAMSNDKACCFLTIWFPMSNLFDNLWWSWNAHDICIPDVVSVVVTQSNNTRTHTVPSWTVHWVHSHYGQVGRWSWMKRQRRSRRTPWGESVQKKVTHWHRQLEADAPLVQSSQDSRRNPSTSLTLDPLLESLCAIPERWEGSCAPRALLQRRPRNLQGKLFHELLPPSFLGDKDAQAQLNRPELNKWLLR